MDSSQTSPPGAKGGPADGPADESASEHSPRVEFALRSAPVGLLLRALLVGLVVQIVMRIITHGPRFMDFHDTEGIDFIMAIVMYFPIFVAVDMGYREGQTAMLARRQPELSQPAASTIERAEPGDNPYQPPQHIGLESSAVDPARLRRVARTQQRIIFCILANVVVIIAMLAVPQFKTPLNIGIYVVGLIASVFVFQLAMQLYGAAAGIGLGLLAILPFVGLVVLLIINGRATRLLERNGIRVGLLGAKVGQIP